VALNSPSNLKLGQLGHIAGGNGNSTSATSLGATCRGSAASTSMWGDFKIGSTAIISDSGNYNGEARIYWKIKVKGDVGEYEGSGQSGAFVEDSLRTGVNPSETYILHINETNDGSLYESRIAQRATNADDYEGGYTFETGSGSFAESNPYTDKDKIRFIGT
jgi:hypothetical protein|tara:strand:+ start:1009 stop:1494 length:486 start_codon:yes stop_codon:yes gene_type:complete